MQIGSSNDAQAVKTQYATSKGLDTRIGFHDKYSVNQEGYSNWMVSHYDIREGMEVLELGCGTGSLWDGRDKLLKKCHELTLADLSEGMLEKAKQTLGEQKNITYLQADIQSLPFGDSSFDVVIANAMLYHVPDLSQALKEVRRVLKPGGVFYCSTFGEQNFTDLLAKWFLLGGESFHPNHNFTLQNGGEKLRTAFEEVECHVYEDSLHITDPEDLVTYLLSLASFKAVLDLPVERIRAILSEHTVDGIIDLPKEYGMFICK